MSELSSVSNEALLAAIQSQKAQPGRDIGISGSFVTGFSSDEAEGVRYAASQLYPDEPIDKAVQRFGKKDGHIVHMADDGKIYEALPQGWSPRAIASDVVRGAGKMLPVGAGAAAGMATLPLAATGVGLGGTMLAAGGAAAGGEVLRQKIGDYMMGPASTGNIDLHHVVQEGIGSAAGQGVGVAMNALATRNAVRDIGRYNPVAANQAYDDAARVGVDITPAEATGLPTLAAQQKRLTNIAPTQDQMREFLDRRSKQVVSVWNSFLDHVSPAADAEDVGLLARAASRDVLKGLKQEAQINAEPWYTAAYQRNVPFTVELEELIKRPAMRDALMKAKEIVQNDPDNPITKQFALDIAADGKKIIVSRIPRMEDYDLLKRGLDSILQSDAAKNAQTGGMNNYGRVITKLKNSLLEQFDDSSKASFNPEYKMARSIYADGAEDLTTAMQSAMKIIADTKDVNILSAAKHVFDPRTRSPQMVTDLRNYIEGQDPNAWQGLKRLYMQDVTTDALRIAEQGDVLNPAGKIFKAFSNPRVVENMRAAMSPQEYGKMQEILAVFRRAASVPAMRSDTEFNRLASQEAETQARPFLSKVARNLNPAQALRSFDEFMTARNMDRNAEKVVDLITTSDPAVLESMKELRRLPLSSQEFRVLFGHIMSLGGNVGLTSAVTDNSDRAPSRQAN